MNNFAPVLIVTLNRYEHFKRCIESLAKCTNASYTDLFIAFDYPASETHCEGHRKIEAYLPKISGFQNVTIYRRTVNFGVPGNYMEGEKQLFKYYDRMIGLEDDNEFSPNFLNYINSGLEKFKDNEKVLAICGYNIPMDIDSLNNENYYFRGGLSWGLGTWKNKWQDFIYDYKSIAIHIFKLSNGLKAYKRNPKHLLNLIYAVRSKTSIHGDVAIGFYMLLNKDVVCVYPTLSKVRNHGHDGSGVNCGVDLTYKFAEQEIDDNNTFSFDQHMADKKVKEIFQDYFAISFKTKLYLLFWYFWFQLKWKIFYD